MSTFISILALNDYVQRNGFEAQLHLIFLVDDLPQIVLNETMALLKAESIQKQYIFTDRIRKLDPKFGEDVPVNATAQDLIFYETDITSKVENIMALDIAIIQFITTVPELMQQNSFKLPTNADSDFLLSEYMLIKEKQVVAKIGKALELILMAEFNSAFQKIPRLEGIIFGNDQLMDRISAENLQKCTNGDPILAHDYRTLVEFYDVFVGSKSLNRETTRSVPKNAAEVTAQKIPMDILNISIDVRQVLYAMASRFAGNNNVNTRLRNFFEGNEDLDRDESQRARNTSKRYSSDNRSLRESTIYTTKVMSLLVYFMILEENQRPEDEMPRHIKEMQNQLILTLTRMVEHLLEYIQYKSSMTTPDYKTLYSQLPLVDRVDPNQKPITAIIYILQYALNFAPFLSSTL